jgi:rod shape-determining protein MreC
MIYGFSKKTKSFLLAVAIICSLLFLHYLKITRPIENIIVSSAKPIFSLASRGSKWIRINYLEYKSKEELQKENSELKEKLSLMLLEASRFGVEAEENAFLREQMKFIQINKYDFQIAEIIGAGADSSQSSFILDKGSRQGIEINQPVIVENGVLIGKISKVNDNTSIVLMVTDDLSAVAATVLNESRTVGVIEGEFGLGIKMKLIPKAEKIEKNDIVITSGLEPAIPRGLLIGTIKNIKNEPEELFLEAAVESPVDFNKIFLVNILKLK